MRKAATFILTAYIIGLSGAAQAATYSGTGSFTFSLPGAVTNAFAFFGPTSVPFMDMDFSGNASASAKPGTVTRQSLSTAASPSGGSVPDGDDGIFPAPDSTGIKVSGAGLEIEGFALPVGSSFAESRLSVTYRLANTTGTLGSPAAETIVVPLTGSYTYDLGANASGCRECVASAFAKFEFLVKFAGADIFRREILVEDEIIDPTVPFSLFLTLPSGASADLEVQARLSGAAIASNFVKPVPLPAGLPLLATVIGGLSLLGANRKRKAA